MDTSPNMMNTSPNMMNTSQTLGPQTMSTMSSAMSPAKSPAKTQISLTMLSGYILAGLVLIGLIVMVVLYMKKPCSPENDCTQCPGQSDCSQCAGTNVTCASGKDGKCTIDGDKACITNDNGNPTGLQWTNNTCSAMDSWTDIGCPSDCNLTLCPLGTYTSQTSRTKYDPRTSSKCVGTGDLFDTSSNMESWCKVANWGFGTTKNKDGTETWYCTPPQNSNED